MLKDPSYCYKFYWLEAIVRLIAEGLTETTFDEIIDEINSTEKDVSCLLGILQEFDKRFEQFKEKNAFYGFSDINKNVF